MPPWMIVFCTRSASGFTNTPKELTPGGSMDVSPGRSLGETCLGLFAMTNPMASGASLAISVRSSLLVKPQIFITVGEDKPFCEGIQLHLTLPLDGFFTKKGHVV